MSNLIVYSNYIAESDYVKTENDAQELSDMLTCERKFLKVNGKIAAGLTGVYHMYTSGNRMNVVHIIQPTEQQGRRHVSNIFVVEGRVTSQVDNLAKKIRQFYEERGYTSAASPKKSRK